MTPRDAPGAGAFRAGALSQESAGRERDKLAEIAGGEPAGEKAQRMPAGRRGARAVAVQALYESDVAGHPAGVVVDRLAADMPDENAVFARELTAYVQREKAALDRMVDGQAKRFPAARMAAVDLNVLRVALAEVALHPETPQAVVINEAVELARLFGGEGSPGFVHGMLGALLR